MAPVNGDATPALPEEAARAPEGVVVPPRDIRVIVEKTAGYVARNGAVFEDRIREKEKSNAKFSFLSQGDAYNAFYLWRLHEVREGRGTAVSAGQVGEAARKEPEKPKGPAPPPDFHFSARMPNISAQDLEVVRLTALFAAKNGRSFITSLSQKEARNYQFDFLRPQHSLHAFFSRLIDQYTDLLQAPNVDGGKLQQSRIKELEANAANRFHVLERAKQRAEWVKFQEQQKAKKEEEEEKEQLEYAQIDWHDFVVVETVLFTEADEQADLPPPASLNDLQSASLEQKAAMSLQPANMRLEEAMPTMDMGMDMGYDQSYTQAQYNAPTPMQAPNPYTPQPQHMGYAPPPPAYGQNDDEIRAIAARREEQERAQAAQAAAKGAAGQPMRIRNDYVPRAQAKRQNATMAICPNCKQQVPVDEITEHMRIELLDPRWKEQRQKADSRTHNLSGIDVAGIKRQRNEEAVVGQPPLSAEEEARRKRAAMGAPGGAVNVEEQIRQIHARHGQNAQ